MTKVAAQPGLYDPDEPTPVLTGTRCDECDSTFFPPFGIGCEVCGNEAIHTVAIEAAGVLHSVATVHRHAGQDIEAPFTVAEVALDEGPLIRALMTEHAEFEAIGQRVRAEWFAVRTDEEGNKVVEPRFTLVGDTS
ncbi:MAG: OB-fold domain-containing protein [Pseudomonadales bacterium]|jgi:hypothetical protein|nr:OB-fold domain-containing protein [Pseudomonadales bacterium]MDP6469715.1 OB-fold domain-containing protein [Pseudomonadales bacterium]MDP6827684.1 OB-fold domain-containing protein [Pseudomonadales bacterium]MDP6971876.1 OB-fold domain-containing protein [Pseudomonadales bacterium]|tara:strand:+ start:1332 stop:1739 length:408 start_codon:yes stop_codon:yes gene_type:complete